MHVSWDVRIRKYGLQTHNPPGPPPIPCLGACVLTHFLLGVDGWTPEARGGGLTGGLVTRTTSRHYDCDRYFLSRGNPHPRIDPGLFARARVDLGVVLRLFATLQRTIGPPRLGTFCFSLPLGSCIFSRCQMSWGKGILGVLLFGLFSGILSCQNSTKCCPFFFLVFCLVACGGRLTLWESFDLRVLV